ncbi:hypothetical protein ACFSKM_15155 [Ancylobacter dichloromethanicus]
MPVELEDAATTLGSGVVKTMFFSHHSAGCTGFDLLREQYQGLYGG